MTISNEDRLLKAIDDGATTYGTICKELGLKPYAKSANWVDRMLQKLRRAKTIEHAKNGNGWRRVKSK